MAEITVVRSDKLSSMFEQRYVVIDKETGEVLDDAQGYGYKSRQKAYAAYGYKNRDKSKDKAKKKKTAHIRQWMKEHKDFVQTLDQYAFEIAKGSWGPDDKVDAKFVQELLKKFELEVDFTAGEFLKVWRG